MERVLAAMSGGVDSSVCAALLKQRGYEVVGATMLLNDETDVQGAETTCSQLDIEFHSIDLRKEFKACVVEPFIREYLSGLTPNPCIFCNRELKFGRLMEIAERLNCRYVATGHYVKKTEAQGCYGISMAEDKSKDQSYVLYALTQKQLAGLLFPLGDITKDKAREIAAGMGLASAEKAESQDICFIPDGDYAEFIQREVPGALSPGDFLDMDGRVIGRHRGVAAYTIGQRRGLNIALGSRAYVVEKNVENNTVTLGTNSDLFSKTVQVANINYISGKVPGELSVTARLRYNQKPQKAMLIPKGTEAILEFDEPQRAPTPGQAAVFYTGEALVGGGTIL